MKKYLNQFERDVFEKLCDAGESYIVGGFVRDIVLGKIKPRTKNIMFLDVDEANDVDIVTTLTPEEVEDLFYKDYIIEPYGKAFGTVAICDENECIDVTTMKKRIYIGEDNLVHVIFGNDIHQDLLLRDFTINTLLINKDYELVDLFGAVDDVKNKRLKYPPSDFPRYKIDPIVIFRAARFISHGFEPDKRVISSFYDPDVVPRLQYLSSWRVLKELWKMSKGDVVKGLYYLHDSGLLYEYFPDMKEHKKYIDEALKTGKKKKFIEYIKNNDPNYIDVFRLLRLNFKRV